MDAEVANSGSQHQLEATVSSETPETPETPVLLSEKEDEEPSTWPKATAQAGQNSPQDVESQTPKAPTHGRGKIITFVYRTLFSVVFIANMLVVVILLATRSNPALDDFATAAAANITVAILVRQDYVINMMFGLCRLTPKSTPLSLRHQIAHIYEYGGVHSGCAVCAVIWFLILTGYLTKEYVQNTVRDPVVLGLSYALVVLFLTIVITAYPRLRFLYHNTFENVHRFAGWSALALFWVELVFFAKSTATGPLGRTLINLPAFWLLIIASLHSVYPWVLLHKVPVTPEKLSQHAIRLHHKENLSSFRGLAISDAPLREWHSFASIPAKNGIGGSLIVSNAGDWTRKTIDNPRPYYYIRGIPATGVLTMATIFRRVVIVTTGSGIGPCLGVIGDMPPSACRVIWSTPAPETTFGREIVQDVREIDPNAIIHDTSLLGRPNLVQLTYDTFVDSGAEAVFCISNKHLTGKVLRELRARGVHAYGPIWDS